MPAHLQVRFSQFLSWLISSNQNGYTHQNDFYNTCTVQIALEIVSDLEKIDFSLAVLQISLKNRILTVVKVENDDENLWNLYVRLNRPLKVYKASQIVP